MLVVCIASESGLVDGNLVTVRIMHVISSGA
jgi:hypothetical protein